LFLFLVVSYGWVHKESEGGERDSGMEMGRERERRKEKERNQQEAGEREREKKESKERGDETFMSVNALGFFFLLFLPSLFVVAKLVVSVCI